MNEDDKVQCIIALEYWAKDTAEHSTAPNLFKAEDTVPWALAQKLRRRIGFIGQIDDASRPVLLKEVQS